MLLDVFSLALRVALEVDMSVCGHPFLVLAYTHIEGAYLIFDTIKMYYCLGC